MEISIVKKKAKEIFRENRKQYILIALLYFTVTLIMTVLTSFLNEATDYNPGVPLSGGHSSNLYISYPIKFIELVISIFFLLWIYSLAYQHSHFKRINENNKDKTMGYILSKSILLGFVLFIMTAPFGIIAELQYSPDNITSNLSYFLINFIVVIITFILEFLVVVYVLQPKKSIWHSIKKSISLVLKNFGTFIFFNLSFVLWFIVPMIVFFSGIALFFDRGISQGIATNVFTVFCLQIMVGLGVYFFPYYNISKFLLCELLLNEIEPPEINVIEKKQSVNRKYLLKSPIEEVLRTEVIKNAIRINENDKSKMERELNLVIPYEYAMKIVDLNWNDVLFAMEQGYFSTKDAVEYAKNEISKKDVLNEVYDLVGLKPSIKDFDEVVHEYVIDFSHRVPKKEKIDTEEKIMYVLLKWGFDHREEYEDPLCFVEKIYEKFDSPVAISEFTVKIPDIDDNSITIDQEMDIFYENWSKYLLEQKLKFSKNSDAEI